MSDKKIKQIERPQSLCDIAAESIRNAIINGYYDLGVALSENSLSESLGISKTPIREALALLKHEGLVTVVPQKGTFVFTMSVNDVAQLSWYRYILEATALDMALSQHRADLLSSLLEKCNEMASARKKNDMSEYLRLDGLFHETIFQHCDNQYLKEGYNSITGKVAALRTHLSKHPTHTDKSMGEHLEITKLLQDGKFEEAKQILERHTTRGERTYADGIEDIATASPEERSIRRSKKL